MRTFGSQPEAPTLVGVKDLAAGVRRDCHTLRKHKFWAVKYVSFDLEPGQVLGLIGPNAWARPPCCASSTDC